MKFSKRYLPLIFCLASVALNCPADAQTPTAPSPAREDSWSSPAHTNPYLRFKPILRVAGIKPLSSGSRKPDALVMFLKNSLGRRIIVAEVMAVDAQNIRLTLIDPQRDGVRVQHFNQESDPGFNRYAITEFQKIQSRGSNPMIVCIDGPEYYFAMRKNGVVTTGRVETCDRPEMDDLGRALIQDSPFDLR